MKVVSRDILEGAKLQGTAKRLGRYKAPKTKEDRLDGIVKLLEALLLQPPQVNVPAPTVVLPKQDKVKSWDFEIVRNPDGFITRIKAERVD